MKTTLEEKRGLSVLGLFVLIILWVITFIVIRFYKPEYTTANFAAEYMWNKSNYKSTKTMILSTDSTLLISACNEIDTLNIMREDLKIKIFINEVEKESIEIQKYDGIWKINPIKKDSQIIALAYKNYWKIKL